MELKQENRRTDVIRCEFCGEDYSVTYRRCPFCDDKAIYTGERTGGKGGKRVATNKRGGGYGGGMQPVQIIGVVLSVILIIAAIYIVFTVLSPLFDRDEPVVSQSSSGASVSQSDASVSQPDASISQPDVSGSGDISTPVVPPEPSGSSGIVTPIVTATDIRLNAADFTLKANETYQLKATLTPADCTDTVVWTSSNESALMVDQNGKVTNVNQGTTQVTVTVTAQVGEVKATSLVRCKGGSTGNAGTAPTTPTTPTTPSTPTTPVASGTVGVVTGTTTGLRIRSGPGTNYQEVDTALNGAEVSILEKTADGWYKINYTGVNGKTKTGYVSADYIKVK